MALLTCLEHTSKTPYNWSQLHLLENRSVRIKQIFSKGITLCVEFV